MRMDVKRMDESIRIFSELSSAEKAESIVSEKSESIQNKTCFIGKKKAGGTFGTVLVNLIEVSR